MSKSKTILHRMLDVDLTSPPATDRAIEGLKFWRGIPGSFILNEVDGRMTGSRIGNLDRIRLALRPLRTPIIHCLKGWRLIRPADVDTKGWEVFALELARLSPKRGRIAADMETAFRDLIAGQEQLNANVVEKGLVSCKQALPPMVELLWYPGPYGDTAPRKKSSRDLIDLVARVFDDRVRFISLHWSHPSD